MIRLVAPHGTVVSVSKPEAVRLRRRGWKPAPEQGPQPPVREPVVVPVEDSASDDVEGEEE